MSNNNAHCDNCKHQEFHNGFFCKIGHWEGLEDRDKFDVDSIEVYEFPFSDCEDFESKFVKFNVFGHSQKGKAMIRTVLAESSSEAIKIAVKENPGCRFNHANILKN